MTNRQTTSPLSNLMPVTLFLLVLLTIMGVAPAKAMSVSPVHVEMTSTGTQARAQITVTNDGATALPIEIGLQKLTLDEAGKPQTSKAADDFMIYPPQAMIKPGATQIFRVQWVGEPQLARSESYLISVNQLPVKMPAGKNAIQVVNSMGVVVNVAPATGIGGLKLVGSTVAAGDKGRPQPVITVENPTAFHALLPRSTIRLSSGAWSKTLTPADLSGNVGIGLVQPGAKRRFVLPVDLPAGATSVQASIEYAPARK